MLRAATVMGLRSSEEQARVLSGANTHVGASPVWIWEEGSNSGTVHTKARQWQGPEVGLSMARGLGVEEQTGTSFPTGLCQLILPQALPQVCI